MQAKVAPKVADTQALYAAWQAGGVSLDAATPVERIETPGRPERPVLVPPGDVAKRGYNSVAGRVRLAHAIAHIEFNAINLALDAVYRFRGMPQGYYADWLQVAAEEAQHFTLLNDYLLAQGSGYGAYSAHNGLWEMALKTDHDVMTRMALVPRVLEARGLDVTQAMIGRLQQAGDTALVDVLQVIFRDEIGHVRIGSHWFNYLCKAANIAGLETFRRLLAQYRQDKLSGPMDESARLQAGFSQSELDFLAGRQ